MEFILCGVLAANDNPLFLAWKIPWTEEPGRLQSIGSRNVRHDWATSLSLSCIGEGNGNPLQCSCLENPRDGGAWWAAVYGVAQSRTRLSDLAAAALFQLYTLMYKKHLKIFFLLKKTISIYLDIIGSIVCVGLNRIIHFIFSSCGICWGSSTRAGRYEMASLKYLLCYLAYLEHLGGPFLSFCYFLTCRIFLSKHYHSPKQCHWNS